MKISPLPASFIAYLLASTTSIQAEETISTKESVSVEKTIPARWSGNSELGFIQTNGNSDTQSFNGKLNITRDLQPTKTSIKFEALTSEESGESSKEKYKSELKLDYTLNEFD